MPILQIIVVDKSQSLCIFAQRRIPPTRKAASVGRKVVDFYPKTVQFFAIVVEFSLAGGRRHTHATAGAHPNLQIPEYEIPLRLPAALLHAAAKQPSQRTRRGFPQSPARSRERPPALGVGCPLSPARSRPQRRRPDLGTLGARRPHHRHGRCRRPHPQGTARCAGADARPPHL